MVVNPRDALLRLVSKFNPRIFIHEGPEEPGRLLIEELHGKDVLNVIAFEGMERIQRAETYKQWQATNIGVGFRQFPFDRKLVN
ncbi:hypothetical protein Ancab_007313 [Ancistrocladus abbreviatus]